MHTILVTLPMLTGRLEDNVGVEGSEGSKNGVMYSEVRFDDSAKPLISDSYDEGEKTSCLFNKVMPLQHQTTSLKAGTVSTGKIFSFIMVA